MQFIQLTDEADREVWVNLDHVSMVFPAGRSLFVRISNMERVEIADPAEIERLRGILSVLASRMGETTR